MPLYDPENDEYNVRALVLIGIGVIVVLGLLALPAFFLPSMV